MKKKTINWLMLICAIVVILACVGIALLLIGPKTPGQSDDGHQDLFGTIPVEHTVTVRTDDGKPAPGVGVYIYEDETMAELVWFDKTDDTGTMSFQSPASDKMIAVLSGIPTGYAMEPFYYLTGQTTEIVLSLGVLTEEDMENMVFKLGDRMLDFTIVDTDGKEHTLSELLKTKKAVVLNFWFINCDPCAMEFPYMQEAYEGYQKDIEILAMNPVDQDEAAVAAYKKEKGLTFPMAVVDNNWEKMMKIMGYPTTVVIDRYGNISLIHTGYVDSADTFRQLFEYFASDEYEPKAIGAIEEILTESVVGTKENPFETGSFDKFEIKVKPGETYYIHLYKQVEKFYLTVDGGDFSLRHKEKDYKSENGAVTIYVKPEGTMVPVVLEITNTTNKIQTYTIRKSNPAGSYSNPYTMRLGEFTAKIAAGNDQGLYYNYWAEKDGALIVKCLGATPGVKYDFTLYNMSSYAQRTLENDGAVDEEGNPYLEVQVRKGQKIQLVVSTLPDSSNSYPAATFTLLAEIDEGKIEEEYVLPQTEYAITVEDQDGKPMQGVTLEMAGDFVHVPPVETPEEGEIPDQPETEEEVKEYPIKVKVTLTTDENGVAKTTQVSGPYTVTVRLPAGYKSDTTQVSLTEEAPTAKVVLKKIVQKDYAVTLQYPDGTPVTGVAVMLGSDYKTTDDNGTVSFRLDEGQYSVTLAGLPEGYILPDNVTTVAFPEGQNSMTLTLMVLGTQENPYPVDKFPFLTKILAPGEAMYAQLTAQIHYEDSPVLTVADPDAAVTLMGQEYVADAETGILQIPMTASETAPVVLITNKGEAEKFLNVEMVYPLGCRWNPEVIESLEQVVLTAAEGDEDGYFYQYTNVQAGDLTLQVQSVQPEGTQYTITMTTEKSGDVQVTETAGTVYMKIGEPALIHIQAQPVEVQPAPDEGTDPEPGEGTDPEPGEGADPEPGEGTDPEPGEGTDPEPGEGTDPEPGEGTEPVEPEYTYPGVTVTLTGSFVADPDAIPEGQMIYTVNVLDPAGAGMAGVMVQFKRDNILAAAVLTNSNGQASALLDVAAYNVTLALPESDTKYYYEDKATIFTPGTYTMSIGLVTTVAGEPVSNEASDWKIGEVPLLTLGTTYLKTQADVWNYYLFAPAQAGLYRVTVSDPDAKVFDGGPDYSQIMANPTDPGNTYEMSIYDGQWEDVKYIIGITGAEDTLVTITRMGDPDFNPDMVEPDDSWKNDYKPTVNAVPTNVSDPKYVDIKDQTAGKYIPVYNEADGFYHMGSKNGPVIYLDMNDNAPYGSVKVAVMGEEGSPAGGAALGKYFYDPDTGEFLYRERYDDTIREYVEVMKNLDSESERFYPLTKNLAHILQNGFAKWWENPDELLYESFQGSNPDIVWLFACCTFE